MRDSRSHFGLRRRCAVLAASLVLVSSSAVAQEATRPAPPRLTGDGALSPNGRQLALVLDDATVLVLDLETRTEKLRLGKTRPGNWAWATWSEDSSKLAVLSADHHVRVHDAKDGSLLSRFDLALPTEELAWVARHVLFAAEGKLLVVVCGNTPTEVRSTATGERIASIPLFENSPVTAAAVSRDGTQLALGDRAGNVSMWDVRTGARCHDPIAVHPPVNALDFQPDAPVLAIGSGDCIVRLWTPGTAVESSRELSHLDADLFGSLEIGYVAFSPDGQRLLSTSSSFWEARLWDVASGEELWRHDYGGGNAGSIRGDFFSGDGRVLLNLNGLVIGEDGELEHTFFPQKEHRGPRISSNGEVAWVIHEDELRVFDLATLREMLDVPVSSFREPAIEDEPVLPALTHLGEFSPNGDELALAARDNSVLLLAIATGNVRLRLDARDSELRSLAWSPDGSTLATLCGAGRVELRSTLDGSFRCAFKSQMADRDIDTPLLFVDEGERLIVVYGTASTEIRSTNDGALIARIPRIEEQHVLEVAVSKDGERVALGDYSGNTTIWSTRTGELLHGPIVLGDHVNTLDFHPNRPLLAAGVDDCKVRLWNFETTAQPGSLSHCDANLFGKLEIGFVKFSPDGRRLLTTSHSFWEARMWDLATHAELWRYDYGGGTPAPLAGTFCADESKVLFELGGVVLDANGQRERALIEDPRWTWVASDGKRAWAIANDRLKVFEVATGEPLLDLALSSE